MMTEAIVEAWVERAHLYGQVFSIGIFERGVTVLKQQVRSLNLV